MASLATVNSSSGLLRTFRMLNSIVRPLEFMERRQKLYGDFYQITFKNAPPTITTCNPQAIEEILTAPPGRFDSGRSNQLLRFVAGDNSILLLDGTVHKHRRKLLMPPFHGESLHRCSQQITGITHKVCDRLELDKPFPVRRLTQEITLRVILSVVFGIDSGSRYDHLRELLTTLLEVFNSPWSSSLIFFPQLQKDWGKFSPWGRFLRLRQEIRTLIYTEIEERRAAIANDHESHQDILSLLLLAKDETGSGLSDAELHDELITLLFAGHETTASALTWLFYWINYLPEVGRKLQEELDSLGDNPNYKEVSSLPYLDATIYETLRIYPIATAAFPRILNQPMEILNHDFQADTWFMISIYNLHHQESIYPNSKQFLPERFLTRKYSSYEYMPFGGGNRRCIGSALALLEMKLVLVSVLSRFSLSLVSKKPMMPVRRGVTLAPPGSFKMIFAAQ